ncbi:MAG: HAMP domain-containing protein [Thermodesulfobacteria bacterium]|nr:HAMP domain-containing protein [Thermodesulfobacteriota bacterium]
MTSAPEIAERRKRKREIAIILLALLLLGALIFVEIKAFKEIPSGEANLLAYALLHLNAILLLLVAYLVIRNVLKIFLDRPKGRLAERLRTRIAVAFLFLALIPTVFLFLVSLKFIDTSLEFWFSSNLDRSLQEALLEAQSIYQEKERELTGKADEFIKRYLKKTKRLRSKRLKEWRKRLRLDSLEVYGASGRLLKGAYKEKPSIRLGVPPSLLKKVLEDGEAASEISKLKDKVLLRIFIPAKYQGKPVAVATGTFLDPGIEKLISEVGKGVETYQQLKFFKAPLKSSLLLMLLLVTLLTIFVAIWFGLRFARRLTEPVHTLAQATSEIANGNFDVELPPESEDEVGELIRAFRRMTAELREYRRKVEETTAALHQANQELRRRTSYLETVLANVTAGVVALDNEERITLINRLAAKLLGAPPSRLIGRKISEVLPQEYQETAQELLDAARQNPQKIIQQPVRVKVREKLLILAITITQLETEEGEKLGFLCLLEDITEKERIQRLAAWREVARRIAHEVKNPLTPIQLSAQRLRRRLFELLDPKNQEILDRCTTTIEKQVEELKHLVNEFSAFARLPALKPERADLLQIIHEVIDLYREGHPEIKFSVEKNGDTQALFDREQMKRVFLNLFDNAIRAMAGGGEIAVRLSQQNGHLRVEVADTGPGVAPEIRDRLFEPYFSANGGSGLGLAIVNSIVREHGGRIWVEENQPRGAKFIIEIPKERT